MNEILLLRLHPCNVILAIYGGPYAVKYAWNRIATPTVTPKVLEEILK